jgi:sjoegren syndrome nuclear autoantigen 1
MVLSARHFRKALRPCHACALQTLTKRLNQVNESLARKQQTRADYEKVIEETDAAYSKIVESSHTLLNVLKKEAVSISKRSTIQTA